MKKNTNGLLRKALIIILFIVSGVSILNSITSSPLLGILFLSGFVALYFFGKPYFHIIRLPWKLWPLFITLWFIVGIILIPLMGNVSTGPATSLISLISGLAFGLSGVALYRKGKLDPEIIEKELPEKITRITSKLPLIGNNIKILLVSAILAVVIIITIIASLSQLGLQTAGFIPTNNPTSTNTPTSTPTNTLTPTFTPTATLTPTSTPTNTPTPTSTHTATVLPSSTPTSTLVPTNTPTLISSANVFIRYVNKVAEYVDLENNGTQPQNLSGWKIVSETGGQTCWLGGLINAGSTLRVWTKNPNDGGYNCNFGTKYIWNNSESDPAALYNEQGKLISRYP